MSKNIAHEKESLNMCDIRSIEKESPDYKRQIIEIACEAFGKGYMSPHDYDAYVKNGGSFFVVQINGRIEGYCCFLHEKTEVIANRIKVSEEIVNKCGNKEGYACYTKSMAVTPKYRRSGIANKLFKKCLEVSIEKGMNSAWGSAWKIENHVPMDKIFRQNGFHIYGEIPMLWYSHEDYVCTVCNGRCRCTGIIYYKLY